MKAYAQTCRSLRYSHIHLHIQSMGVHENSDLKVEYIPTCISLLDMSTSAFIRGISISIDMSHGKHIYTVYI